MNFPFDYEEALKSGIYISGTTGTGKSDIAMYIADHLMKQGVTIIIFDPSQDWINRSSIPHYRNPTRNPVRTIPEHSVIYDLSEATPRQQQTFVETFCQTIMLTQAMKKQRKQYFLIFEEAHTYFPEGCMRAKRCQNTMRMMTQGRNYKVRFACITQFASLIDKNAMRYMKQRYFGYTDEPNDVEYVTSMFPKAFRPQAERYLRTLKTGQFIYKHGENIDVFTIKPFHTKTKPKLEEAQPMQPTPPTRKHTDAKALAGIVTAILWFLAILYGLSQRM